jgi:hypothetical protein
MYRAVGPLIRRNLLVSHISTVSYNPADERQISKLCNLDFRKVVTWPGTVLGPWEGGGDARGGGPGNQQQQAGRYHGRPRDSSTAQRGRGVGRGGRPWRSQGPPGAQPCNQRLCLPSTPGPLLAPPAAGLFCRERPRSCHRSTLNRCAHSTFFDGGFHHIYNLFWLPNIQM